MTWEGLNVLQDSEKCTDKKIPDVTYKVDVCRIRRVGETGTCFECRKVLELGETVYKIHKQILHPPKENICVCQECFSANFCAVV